LVDVSVAGPDGCRRRPCRVRFVRAGRARAASPDRVRFGAAPRRTRHAVEVVQFRLVSGRVPRAPRGRVARPLGSSVEPTARARLQARTTDRPRRWRPLRCSRWAERRPDGPWSLQIRNGGGPFKIRHPTGGPGASFAGAFRRFDRCGPVTVDQEPVSVVVGAQRRLAVTSSPNRSRPRFTTRGQCDHRPPA